MEGEPNKEAEKLPPGFRFHPTDEELISSYLVNKISDASFTGRAITDVDLNKCEPWDLPGKAKMGEKEWYFFSLRDRKYPTGVRTNRATNTGYWKTTGKDKEIFSSNGHGNTSEQLVGMKKTLVFYRGRAPRGEKTNWVMHEYRVHAKSAYRTSKDEWVVCRVFQKSAGGKKYSSSNHSRGIMNPYNLEIGPASGIQLPPQIMSTDPNYQFPVGLGRTYMTNADMAEYSRVFRGNTSNMPLHQNQINYPNGGGAECFTISGLNLNLRGSTSTQMRSEAPPPQPQEDLNSSILCELGNEQGMGYGGEMSSNGNGLNNNRFMAMDQDQCAADLDNYWAPLIDGGSYSRV